jgi:retinol dehydrogenase 12
MKMPLIKRSEWESFEAQKKGPPPITKVDLSGKVVVVTGANTGLGYDAAKHFAGMNPKKLILACRSEERGKEALKSEYYLVYFVQFEF